MNLIKLAADVRELKLAMKAMLWVGALGIF